jgi:hypothetical protein
VAHASVSFSNFEEYLRGKDGISRETELYRYPEITFYLLMHLTIELPI